MNPLLPADGRRNADGAYWVLPASDGWVRVVVGSPKQWAGFKTLMRNPDVFEADEWRNPQFRLANSDVIRMLAQERLTDRTRAELFAEALRLGATVGVLHQPQRVRRAPADPHAGVLRRDRRRRPRRSPVRDAPGEAGAHAVVDPSRRVGATRHVRAETVPLGRGRELLLDGVRVDRVRRGRGGARDVRASSRSSAPT